jgi:hypothetical protein
MRSKVRRTKALAVERGLRLRRGHLAPEQVCAQVHGAIDGVASRDGIIRGDGAEASDPGAGYEPRGSQRTRLTSYRAPTLSVSGVPNIYLS